MKSQSLYNIFILFSLLLLSALGCTRNDKLDAKISAIVNKADGQIGAAVLRLEDGEITTVNDSYCYPMQSVYKFPLALAVLNEIDKGTFALDTKILLTQDNLLPDTWSPLRDKYPVGNVDVTVAEILESTVAWSDNNGCDILFGLLGGPSEVNSYINSLGIENINILSTEEEMHADQTLQYRNCSAPSDMAKLMGKFTEGKILTEGSTKFLWEVMVNTVTGTGRLKGNLPEGTKVAHKTGSSGVNEEGLAPATNDAGIIVLPDGSKIVVVVFVSDSHADDINREKVIADIAKAVWDYYNK